MVSEEISMIRYGHTEPIAKQRILRAGPLTAVLEDGGLRYIRLHDQEIVRGIYVAVRDHNWGTILPSFRSYEAEQKQSSFQVRFIAEHIQDSINFIWNGSIEGTQDGTIHFHMNGVARKPFRKNRIGFCVLHPMELAGSSVEVQTTNGTIKGTFPKQISPHQPFQDMTAIKFDSTNGEKVELKFEGDLFEMEDQRNWTDASFKTYCTPLGLPYPVEVKAGDTFTQSITLSVHAPIKPSVSHIASKSPIVHVENRSLGKLPMLGLVSPTMGRKLSNLELERIQALNLSHLRTVLDLDAVIWESSLFETAHTAKLLSVALELEVIVGDQEESLKRLISHIKAEQIPVRGLFLYPDSGYVTDEQVLKRARKGLESAACSIPIGGGSRAYFAHFNRAQLPIEQMEFAGYSINPQVHAFDHTSLIESLSAQAATVNSARAIVHDLPLCLGPITFKPRFNPESTDASNTNQIDSRQYSLFGAGWTIGSIRHLASGNVSALTYYETLGALGLMEIGGEKLFPLYYAFASLGEFSQSEVLSLAIDSDPFVIEALALQDGSRKRVWIANLSDEEQLVTLQIDSFPDGGKLRMMDETTFHQNQFQDAKPIIKQNGHFQVNLLPFAVAWIDSF